MVIGGGQDAMNVTMTDRRAGKFEAKFFHKVSSLHMVSILCFSENNDSVVFFCNVIFSFSNKTLIFYFQILQEEIGGVKGHFGPINALAFNPDGRR